MLGAAPSQNCRRGQCGDQNFSDECLPSVMDLAAISQADFDVKEWTESVFKERREGTLYARLAVSK